MISVTQALDALFELAKPLGGQDVPLAQANGRVLLRDAVAQRTQPPFAGSAMDGYAVAGVKPGDQFTVIGESAAGHRFEGTVQPGQAVRIFTGAPVPAGAQRVVIQEDVTRSGDTITVLDSLEEGTHIRPAGNDFVAGHRITALRILGPNDIALLAAMNIPTVHVSRKPKVALISTGDELVMPGETPGPDQIIASNTFGLQALLHDLGADVRMLPIARDNEASLRTAFALSDDADLVVTIGGASVGDHDLVTKVSEDLGVARSFYKVAMRPGKPLMSGRFGDAMMVGLPGNPVSAMVCGHVFLAPVIRAMLGLPAAAQPRQQAVLSAPLKANGPREHYMRATLGPDGIAAADRQDSSLLTVLAGSNALLVRPPHDPARANGETVDFIAL